MGTTSAGRGAEPLLRCGIGVRFVDIRAEDEAVIERFIDTIEKPAAPRPS